MKKIGIVVTTIFDGKFLHKYVSAVATAREHHEIAFYVVGDQNTSPVCRRSSEEVASTFPCAYMDIAEQEKTTKCWISTAYDSLSIRQSPKCGLLAGLCGWL